MYNFKYYIFVANDSLFHLGLFEGIVPDIHISHCVVRTFFMGNKVSICKKIRGRKHILHMLDNKYIYRQIDNIRTILTKFEY